MTKGLRDRIGEVKYVRAMWSDTIITEGIELKEIGKDEILLISSSAAVKFPQAGERISVAIYCINGVFLLDTKVQKLVFNSPYSFCYIKIPESYDIRQQREFFRTRFNLKAELTIYYNNGEKKVFECQTFDISGNGTSLLITPLLNNENIMELVSNPDIKKYAQIGLCLHFSDKDIKTKVEFVNKRQLSDNTKIKVCAFKFLNINPADVDYITRQCFIKQLTDQNKSKKEF